MKNRIEKAFENRAKLLSIYFTAGYPNLEDTVPIITALENNGVDMIEIGLPFSDPLADGPTIQESSKIALQNGMTTHKLFAQLEGIRRTTTIPLLIMGYFNPILQFGVEQFCARCAAVGIDGLIIPDLPLNEYNEHYASIFRAYNLDMVFLITPQTSEARIREIDQSSRGFIYMVSTASTTGGTGGFDTAQDAYFQRISAMNLNNPLVVGFGIHDQQTFERATNSSNGAIIGSAFIKMLTKTGLSGISEFIARIRP